MFARILKRSRPEQAQAVAIYEAIVAQARHPALYRDHGVPDTVDGRFEMVVLHMVSLFQRLGRDDNGAQPVVQEVFDTFLADMDRSLREMGVSDLGVPKRMKAMGKSFYGRLAVYGKALGQHDRAGMVEALQRNLYPETDAPDLGPLADYALAVADRMRVADRDAVLAGSLDFPNPTGQRLEGIPA